MKKSDNVKRSGELYHYDFRCELVGEDAICLMVAASEKKLPAPSKMFDGICCSRMPKISRKLEIGSVVDVAFGDPIVLRNCTLLSRNQENLPEIMAKVREQEPGEGPILTFEYRGKKLWVCSDFACLLKELEKEKAARKEKGD